MLNKHVGHQILENTCLHSRGNFSHRDFYETLLECLLGQYLGQVRILVMSGQKQGHHDKS